ncbi:MAG: FGGY-family carbohydrate kinase [Deltaproteobacteria bacterium]|nr:FGGY-family carbohydrate kinase [Deltaproteobacteria bacterium]
MADKDECILAIDLGTSGPKTALISVYGEVLASEFEETPVILLSGGGAEQDPDDWWKAIMSTAKKLLSKNLVAPDDIVAVSVTTQWSGTVAVGRDGHHLMNAVIWMDCRGAETVRDMMAGMIKINGLSLFKSMTWLRLTGGVPSKSGKDSICHILWIKNNYPEIYRNTYKFLDPKDYINLRFTGRFAATFDSILLHWVTDNRDQSRIVYSDKLLKVTGIAREKLPDLIQALDILGPIKKEIAAELGLNPKIPVIGGTPDVPSASVGSGAVRDYEGHLYVGTSSWISAHVPFKKTDVVHGFGSFPSPVPGRYIILSEQESAGKCLTWLKDNILYHKDALLKEEDVPDVYKLMDNIAAQTPAGANGVVFTPWLYGERSPVEDCHIRASLFNLSLENTREDIIRAVFEGVAFNNRWLMRPVEKFMRRPFEYLNFVGGGANSDIWSQIFADVLDRKIRQVKDPIYSNARGAAFLAAMALKYIALEDIPNFIKIKAEYLPNPDTRKLYDDLFNEFTNHYKTQKEACRRLNQSKGAVCALEP